MNDSEIIWRTQPTEADTDAVEQMAAASGFFYPEEVVVARELVEERLAKGLASGYHFVLADEGGELAGYACLGPIPCTQSSWDLYWIVVGSRRRGQGLGGAILARSEALAKARGATRVYVETSSRPLYEPTRGFYLARGYRVEATMADFYAPGDAKVVFLKELS